MAWLIVLLSFSALVATFVAGAKYGRWAENEALGVEQRIKADLLKRINKLH
jgi:hypothetical protein